MNTPIMGKSLITPKQCENFLRKQNSNAPYLANIYRKYCDIYGIRLECIWVQMCLETNYLRYSDTSITTLDMHNYAGLGALDNNKRRQALIFMTEDEGVKCHVQHLYAYCTTSPLPKDEVLIDPRFKYVIRGIAPNIENLGNGTWASDKNYSSKLLKLLNQLLSNSSEKQINLNNTAAHEVTIAQDGGVVNTPDNSMTYAFIKSIQHDLQRLSCLEPGESNAAGSIDNKTKQAIMQFRYIVDLPSSSNIDNNFINALNLITKKPTIGAGWPSNPIATKFVKWYIGITPRNDLWDDDTVEKVKIWQVKAGIWSVYGADGVIREKDWNKILK